MVLERDQFRQESKEMAMSKTKTLMTTGMYKKFNNDKIKRFEDMVRDLKLKCEERHEQIVSLEKKNKLLVTFQDKLK